MLSMLSLQDCHCFCMRPELQGCRGMGLRFGISREQAGRVFVLQWLRRHLSGIFKMVDVTTKLHQTVDEQRPPVE